MSTITGFVGYTYVHKVEVGNEGLDLPDDLWFGSGIKGFELDVEHGLFLWLFLYRS